jgi:cephalosporin hydroxylase
MERLIDAFAGDLDVARRVETCKWMQSLSIPLLREDDPDSAEMILAKLKEVAQRCAVGDFPCAVEGSLLDDRSQAQFREAMSDLIKIFSDGK